LVLKIFYFLFLVGPWGIYLLSSPL